MSPADTKKSLPIVAARAPKAVELKDGEEYYWCRCGRSKNQPFCDGSHKDTEYSPERFEAIREKYIYFCGCKQTSNAPFCDGSHKDLPVAEYAPRQIKKAVVGTGNATKEQVGFMVKQQLRLRDAPSPADAADGVAAALCHCMMGSFPAGRP